MLPAQIVASPGSWRVSPRHMIAFRYHLGRMSSLSAVKDCIPRPYLVGEEEEKEHKTEKSLNVLSFPFAVDFDIIFRTG